MYYLVNPQDGQRVQAPGETGDRLGGVEIQDESEAPEGAVIVDEMPVGHVWDEASQELRPRTEEELAQKELDEAKYEKQVEFFTDFLLERINANPEVIGDYSNISTDLLLKGILSILFDFLKQEPARLQGLGEEVTKLLTKRQNVQSKTLENSSPEEVREESWDA